MSEGVITLTKTLLRSFHGTGCGLLIYCLLASTISFTQTALNSQAAKPYNIEVSVDEIRVIFHASDASGQPVGDLTPSELDLFDNESGPGQIVAMQKLKERPLRIAFVVVQGSTLQPPPPTPVTVNVSGILSLVSSVVNEGLTLATDGLVTGDTAALLPK